MLLTEFEGKAVLAEAGIAVPGGAIARSPDEAADIAAFPVAIKAQVAAGGRGLAGGIAKASDAVQARNAIRRIMNIRFDGLLPESVLIEPWLPIQREMYLSICVEGEAEGYTVLYSAQGGVDIERGPPPIRYAVGHPSRFRGHALRALLSEAEHDAGLRERIISLARRLLTIAVANDCLTVEINPLVKLEDGSIIAADAKIVVDDSAAYRNARITSALAHSEQAQPAMVARALAQRLMLVWLGGEIGLISGGAGMTMAAMDMIKDAGSTPSCFLDCSSNPTPDGYATAFELLDRQDEVRVILVSIFGGGTHMDRAAKTMVAIMAARISDKPVIFRLNGTKAAGVDAVFAAAGLSNFATLEEAVVQAVAMTGRHQTI